MWHRLGVYGNFERCDDVLGGGKPTKHLRDEGQNELRACNQPVQLNHLDSQAAFDRLDLFLQGANADIDALVREKVDSLPKDLRDVVILSIQGFTQEEIAAKLFVTRDFVRHKLKLIRENWGSETVD